jgi:signal transduction histidine kinase
LTRIVQEALLNIRKHSGATLAHVNLQFDDWAWRLNIKDNGRGFGFHGNLSHAQLVARRIGPRTIRERVEAVGGKLQLLSGPEGVQLEMIGRLKKPWILTPSA